MWPWEVVVLSWCCGSASTVMNQSLSQGGGLGESGWVGLGVVRGDSLPRAQSRGAGSCSLSPEVPWRTCLLTRLLFSLSFHLQQGFRSSENSPGPNVIFLQGTWVLGEPAIGVCLGLGAFQRRFSVQNQARPGQARPIGRLLQSPSGSFYFEPWLLCGGKEPV